MGLEGGKFSIEGVEGETVGGLVGGREGEEVEGVFPGKDGGDLRE